MGLTVLVGVLAAPTAEADSRETLSLRVLVVNQAGVPDATLREAELHATRTFSAVGIALLWTNTKPAEPYDEAAAQARIVIAPDSRVKRDPRRLATAHTDSMAAYVFYKRITALAAYNGADGAALLGHVIAHEIGHLLLPADSHSSRGLMRAEWDRTQFDDMAKGLLTFVPKQVQLIRSRARAVLAGTSKIEPVAGEPGQVHTIRIVVLNEAAVPEEILRRAQMQAEQTYERIGVGLIWAGGIADTIPPGEAVRLAVKIVPHSKLGYADEAMGLAVNGGNLAYVFYGRVVDFAEEHQIEPAIVLGHVLAHETGHLLLAHRPHPSTGIMRAHWNRAHDLAILRSASGLSFTTEEAELIRRTIETTSGGSPDGKPSTADQGNSLPFAICPLP